MPFIGVEPTQEFASVAKQTITGTGATAYSLNHSVASANDLAVFINNVRQEPTSAYTASGGTITFTSALASTDSCYIVYIARTFSVANAEASSVGITELNVSDGTSGQALITNGSGTLSFATISSPITANSVGITELNVSDGTSGQALTTNGSGTLSFATPEGPTIQAVASGTLANGDLVIINSDGTVSAVTETIGAGPPAGAQPVEYSSAYSTANYAVYDSNAQKVVIAYKDGNNSNYGTAVVGTVSGTSISFGTGVVFSTNNIELGGLAYDSNAQKVVIPYRDGSNSQYGTAIVGTVSGTSISFGTAVVFNSAASYYVNSVYDSNAQKVVIFYRDQTNYRGTGIVGTVSGTSISFGTSTTFSSDSIYSSVGVYDSNAQKVVIAYKGAPSPYPVIAVVGTVSGTSISFGTPVSITTVAADYTKMAYDSNAQKVVILYYSGSSMYAIVGTVSGTSISFGTAVSTGMSGFYQTVAYHSNAQKVVVIGGSTGRLGTVSGTSISLGTPFFVADYNPFYPAAVYDSNAQKVVFANSSSSSNSSVIIISDTSNTTNLTLENYIGISSAAYSNAATATIQVIGSVDDAQSGLTPGRKYYSQKDGSLSLTPIFNGPAVVAGTAISSTELIIKG